MYGVHLETVQFTTVHLTQLNFLMYGVNLETVQFTTVHLTIKFPDVRCKPRNSSIHYCTPDTIKFPNVRCKPRNRSILTITTVNLKHEFNFLLLL